MITPKFSITQDEEYLHITIHAPYVKAQNVDFYVDGREFRFHIAPYFLRLNLPGEVIEDDRATSKYDLDKGDFIVKVAKVNKGEKFEDLDLLSKLLASKAQLNNKHAPIIEVLNSTSHELPPSERFTEEDIDWEIPQEVPVESFSLLKKDGYGFNQQHSGYFEHIQETPNEINEIPNPESSTFEERRAIRIQSENEKFDDDHYINDYLNQGDPSFQNILNFKTKWAKAYRDVQKEFSSTAKEQAKMLITPINEEKQAEINSALIEDNVKRENSLLAIETPKSNSLIVGMEENVQFTNLNLTVGSNDITQHMEALSISGPLIQETSTPTKKFEDYATESSYLKLNESEKETLLNLHNREYIIDRNEERSIYLGLVDLILAYCYDHRVTEGEHNVESSWCIGKISPTMSCLEKFHQLEELLLCNYRRTLSYPLYRNFKLAEKVQSDAYIIFKLGKRAILKALLALKYLFDHHDVHYRYSKILIDDYIVWLQSYARDNVIRGLAHQLHKSKIGKDMLDEWYIISLEELAKEAELQEE